MIRKHIIMIGFSVILLVAIIGFGILQYSSLANTEIIAVGFTGVGKVLGFEVPENSVRNYTFFEDNKVLELWDKNEKEKMIQYMKKNNLIIVPGTYSIQQGTKFENALQIIKLESIKHFDPASAQFK